MTSNTSADCSACIFFGEPVRKLLDHGDVRGRGGALPLRLRSMSSFQYSSIDVSLVCMHSMTIMRSDQ